MNPPPRRVATPSPSVKRKETDHFRPSPVLTKSLKPPPPRNSSAHASKSTFPLPHPGSAKPTPSLPSFNSTPASKLASSTQAAKSNNLILAGYMAHEYLTKGTILGDKPDPSRAAAEPPSPDKILSRSNEPSRKSELSRKADERYVEVSSLLKTSGSHISGIVNPTQLASYLNR